MFISQAFAQTADAAASTAVSSGANEAAMFGGSFIQIMLIFLILYFFLIRPQQKKLKEHQSLLKGIIKGTKVIVSGIVGTVTQVKDDELVVQIASGVEVTVLRDYVSQVVVDSPKKEKKK